jgi:DNA helicase HerA-like ATPase
MIRAELAKDPLLGGRGTPLDPAVLFTSERKGKTRISVINFSGLPSDEAKQAFVNQLQMALFSWIKRHPAPLRGLLVMDEAQNFAPAQKSTPCKESALALVSQARKYGLGLLFATQAPRSIDNKIISNCTTHFYGRMNSPATIAAIRDLMASKGARGDDISTLKTGEFYFSTEGTTPEKLKSPLCLTHHPPNALSQDEVVERARRSAQGP